MAEITGIEPVFEDRQSPVLTVGRYLLKGIQRKVVGSQGFEPHLSESKSEVLPLHHEPVRLTAEFAVALDLGEMGGWMT